MPKVNTTTSTDPTSARTIAQITKSDTIPAIAGQPKRSTRRPGVGIGPGSRSEAALATPHSVHGAPSGVPTSE
jgi:hypothetical protein